VVLLPPANCQRSEFEFFAMRDASRHLEAIRKF
jgi:hypothetical protein